MNGLGKERPGNLGKPTPYRGPHGSAVQHPPRSLLPYIVAPWIPNQPTCQVTTLFVEIRNSELDWLRATWSDRKSIKSTAQQASNSGSSKVPNSCFLKLPLGPNDGHGSLFESRFLQTWVRPQQCRGVVGCYNIFTHRGHTVRIVLGLRRCSAEGIVVLGRGPDASATPGGMLSAGPGGVVFGRVRRHVSDGNLELTKKSLRIHIINSRRCLFPSFDIPGTIHPQRPCRTAIHHRAILRLYCPRSLFDRCRFVALWLWHKLCRYSSPI